MALSERIMEASGDGEAAREAENAFDPTVLVGVDVAAEKDARVEAEEDAVGVAERHSVGVPDPVEEAVVVAVSHDDVVNDAEGLPEELADTEGEAVADTEPDGLPVCVLTAVCDEVACPEELAAAVKRAEALELADTVAIAELDWLKNVGSAEAEASFERTVPDGVLDAAEKVTTGDGEDEDVAVAVAVDELVDVALDDEVEESVDSLDGDTV